MKDNNKKIEGRKFTRELKISETNENNANNAKTEKVYKMPGTRKVEKNEISEGEKFVEKVIEKIDENKKNKTDDEKKDTIDYIYANHIIKQDCFAVEKTENGEVILYKWVRDRMLWQRATNNDVNSYVSKWIRLNHRKMYRNSLIKTLSELTDKVVLERGRILEKHPGFIISTNTHFLEVDNLGNIKATFKATDKDVKDKFCKIHVNIDIEAKGGRYITKSDEEVEGNEQTLFAKMIRASFPDETNRRHFQEFFGDTLNPITRKCFPIMIGDPDGGKSQWLKLLQEMHTNSTAVDFSSDDSTEYSHIIGKSLLIVDELGKRPSEVMIKRIVGGASFMLNVKYKNPISISPDFKLFGADNFEYNFSGKSGAIATRFYLFKVEEVKREDRIDEVAEKVVQKEMRDVLDWMLNGAIRIVRRGRILRHSELSKDSLYFHNQMKRETNPTIQFLDDFDFTYDNTNLVSVNEIYEQFKEWCVEMGHTYASKVSLQKFSRDFLRKAIKEYILDYDERYEKKTYINFKGRKIRAACLPIKYNKHGLADILNNNYQIDKKDIDENIIKNAEYEKEKQRKLQESEEYKKKMKNQEDKLNKMIETGEARVIDGGIEIGDKIDF